MSPLRWRPWHLPHSAGATAPSRRAGRGTPHEEGNIPRPESAATDTPPAEPIAPSPASVPYRIELRVVRVDGADTTQGAELDGQVWRDILVTAIRHGWRPSGTRQLVRQEPEKRPDGTRVQSLVLVPGELRPWPNGYGDTQQRIAPEDAAALIAAVEQSGDAWLISQAAILRAGAAAAGVDLV